MARGRMVMTVAAASLAVGAMGYALGVLFAPASGHQTRRRLAWRARRGYRSMERTCEGMFDRVAEVAGGELKATVERVVENMGKRCAG